MVFAVDSHHTLPLVFGPRLSDSSPSIGFGTLAAMRLRSRRVVLGDGLTSELRVAPATITLDGSLITAVEEHSPATAKGAAGASLEETKAEAGRAEEPRAEEGRAEETAREGDSGAEVDLGDMLVTPAFVDAHTHVALHALRGVGFAQTAGNIVEDLFYRFESLLEPSDVAAFARMGAYDRLLSGTGLVWDHYFFGSAIAEALAELPLCAVIAPTLQDLNGPGAERWEQELEATDAIARSTGYAASGVYAAVGPHATDTVSAELWSRVTSMAQSHNIPLHCHLAQSVEEVERAEERHGLSPARWLQSLGVLEAPGLFAHALFVSTDDLPMFAHARHRLVVCPHAQLHFAFPARVDLWEAAAVRWTVGTDAAASNDASTVREELRLLAGLRTIPTSHAPSFQSFAFSQGGAREVWRERARFRKALGALATPTSLLTRSWAEAGSLHPALQAGVIAPGALANLVVWDLEDPSTWPALDPLAALVFAQAEHAIHGVINQGRWVGQRGDFRRSVVSSDVYVSHRAEARERLDRLLQRLP